MVYVVGTSTTPQRERTDWLETFLPISKAFMQGSLFLLGNKKYHSGTPVVELDQLKESTHLYFNRLYNALKFKCALSFCGDDRLRVGSPRQWLSNFSSCVSGCRSIY